MAASPQRPGGGMRFQNVTVYIGGQSEYGTLQLTEHHLRFSYIPRSSAKSSTTKLSGTSTSADQSHLPDGAVNSADNRSDHGAKTTPGQGIQSHPKEIWVPYPMINFCLLRPSTSSISHSQASGDRMQNESVNDEDDLFPPVFGTATYGRPSTDSTHLAVHSSPARPSSPSPSIPEPRGFPESGRQPVIRIRRRDFQMMAFHFHQSSSDATPDESARRAFFLLRSRCCIQKVEDMHAFHFEPPKQETAAGGPEYDARREFARMGISDKAADGPGTAWRLSTINQDYSYSPTYPSILCVPRAVSDNMLKYGGAFRSRSRIPCLAYLHPNGGSITRSSQPMVGVQNKRNPQDERLVSAIFSSHTPPLLSPEDSPVLRPTATLEPGSSDLSSITTDSSEIAFSKSETTLDESTGNTTARVHSKIYGSTRQNLIVDARPKINALANRATGGGIEEVANYMGTSGIPVQKIFLNIANIHVMRASLEKVVESLASADYLNMKPNQELLRKSGWLGHIAGLLDGSEVVARVVGLGGSHALVHCSDGWDRTAQVSALAQVMLDSHYRTLDGFIVLVQKDFFSFGHKFRDRNGIEGSEKWFEIEHERIAPSPRTREHSGEQSSLNVLGSRALSGAKTWFEKNRGNLFRQQNGSRESLPDLVPRPGSPPPNPIIHSPPTATTKDDHSHRMSEKEIAPIFHQFLDAIYQLQRQNPDAFEFNERFLRRLFYHTYACQYGEFLFNTERDRQQHRGRSPSVWGHFLSRRHEFTNSTYAAKLDDPLLFPRRQGAEREIEVRWWSGLFRCQDDDMNVPTHTMVAAATAVEPPTLPSSLSTSVSMEDGASAASSSDALSTAAAAPPTTTNPSSSSSSNGIIKETKSMPGLTAMRDSISAGVSSLTLRLQPEKADATTPPSQDSVHATPSSMHQPLHPPAPAPQPSSWEGTPLPPVPDHNPDEPPPAPKAEEHDLPEAEAEAEAEAEDEGDPLGVSTSVAPRSSSSSVAAATAGSRATRGAGAGGGGGGEIDSAASAAQNAFRPR